ncbi:MAG TPA: isopentenyl phosphate kinase family protein [Thermoplasmatales archaeon]|nr:isopentenyl phosphate kinase family protein [Thermoplasmatales archaeon]
MILVKLGGSVVTDKNKQNTVRRRVLNRLSKEIEEAEKRVIIVHGAGSFGHISAEHYALNNGYMGGEQKKGFALTHQSVRLLNNIVLESLIKADIPAISLPPLSFLRLKNKKLSYFDGSWFKDAFKLGLTPVTFGDVVIDRKMGFSICSGDLLMVALSAEFKPERAVFVIDEEGVYSANPKLEKTAKLLKNPSLDELKQVATPSNSYADVTGGMMGKVESICDIAAMGVDVWVVNGNKKDRTYRALIGKKTKGTIVKGVKT